MKTVKLITAILSIGILSFTLINCGETEPNETCANAEICTGKNVTTCCDADQVCVYKYNGNTYTEDQLAQLADDLGCAAGNARVAAEENEQLIFRLEALMAQAKRGLN